MLSNNLAAVRQRMHEAATRAGRAAADVTLVAVTKYVDAEVTRALAEAGCRTLGESRPQALWEKAQRLGDLDVTWHLIGHLQRNKIRRTLPLLHCVESADSQRLLESLQQEARRLGRLVDVLLEVNISGDAEKTGLSADEACRLAPQLGRYDALHICGLMAMSGRTSDEAQARREFCAVRKLRDRMQQRCPGGIELPQLSMGMSGDYELAIEEGATTVRVGSALFEGVST
jgi:pyridoxal phosphate enzyme (YggS family)